MTREDEKEVLTQIEETLALGKTELDLSGRELTALPPDIGKLTNLITLDISFNQLTTLPPEIGKLTNLTQLNLFDGQLMTLPLEIGKLTNLISLFISRNRLTTLPSEIGKLTNLTTLLLSRNQLTSLPSDIGKLTNLTALDLDNNKLKVLPHEIENLTKLTRLRLNNNQLKSVPSEIWNLTNLTELYLGSNQLTSISKELGNLTNITELSLSNNQLTTLPKELGNLTNLNELHLSSNELNNVPKELGNLKNLTSLNLRDSKLTTLPPEIGQLNNLTSLNLIGSKLTTLPPEIGQLNKLTSLDLSETKLTTLPPEISQLKNLTSLDLSNTQLTTLIPEIWKLTTLTKIYLEGIKLSKLPPEIGNLTNLTILDLEKTQLKKLPSEIINLKKLKTLYFNENQIKAIPPEIFKLTNLTDLYLRSNKLTTLSPEIMKLTNLTELSFGSNKLTTLPPEIMKLTKLTELRLYGNPLEKPPMEIAKKGIEAIRNYFKSLEGEKQALNEVKVLLVGDGGAGKTSLVKRMLDIKFDKDEPQTDGINISDWKVKVGDTDIKVHLWDFGGQEIMHATHQFFLSKRSLYILVLDGRKDEKTEYWLKHIESFGGDSPILVVINKTDQNPGFDVNRNFLQEKYKGIKGFYRVSCAKNRGIKIFAKNLKKALTSVELLQTTWPKTWFDVKTQLQNVVENFISYDKYKSMCEKEKITEKSSQDTLVDFLNDLGIILHFKDLELLDTHVLEPTWVAEAVYKIINSEQLAKSKGVLKVDLLDEILKKKKETDFEYPPERYSYIIELMKKFELCYEIDKKTVLIPDLLDIQEPKLDFDYKTALRFLIEYDFLPKSVMPRFIVKMHRDINNKLQWRTGVVLEDKDFNSTAVIKADNDAKKIYIYVNGEQKRDYFAVILFNLREINRSFEKLKAIEKVPMSDDPEISVSYKHLITLEKEGTNEYFPDGAKRKYNVSELLGSIQKEKMDEEEILRILDKIVESAKTEKEILRILEEHEKKSESGIIAQPTFFGFGLDLKVITKKLFHRKKNKGKTELVNKKGHKTNLPNGSMKI